MHRRIPRFLVVILLTSRSSVIAQEVATRPEPPRNMGALLMQGLREVEGCLEVKTCEWNDGKRSIVAWFEDKDAAVAWYYSDTHQAMIGTKTDGTMKNQEPMQYVTDQPVMVIATLTPAHKPELPGVQIPISQISIELFSALPGGAQIGGRVSPPEFKIPHMRDYTSPARIE